MRRAVIFFMFSLAVLAVSAQKVTVAASNQPASVVFRSIVEQTGKNFVYSSELLKGVKVNVNAHNRPLKKVLEDMFRSTDIDFTIKGNNVILKRKKRKERSNVKVKVRELKSPLGSVPDSIIPTLLEEVVIVSRLEDPVVETAEIGARKISASEVASSPALLGEPDVVRTVQKEPGVSEGAEMMAGMYVHGGNADENLCMLDNVPLYQVNHFAGLFSAFNTDILRYIDFYKSSVPARFDGRLSSFMDVRLRDGSREGHHGSARLGLTSGAFNISGPIGHRTSYLVGLRRSWYDVLTIPALAFINSRNKEEKTRFRYYFMDLNGRVSHRFNPSLNGFISVYYGNDLLKTGSEDTNQFSTGWYENDRYDFSWGNFVAQAGLNWRLSPVLSGEFTAAYTRYFSQMKHDDLFRNYVDEVVTETRNVMHTANNINDWIFRADFDWHPAERSRVRFGAGFVCHSFLPGRTSSEFKLNGISTLTRDSVMPYHASEVNLYIEDDWRISDKFRTDFGLHGSLFAIDGKTYCGLSPRLSISWQPAEGFAVKGAYTHTVQYVHQLTETYLSLPTDRWIPVCGDFKPESADKVSLGGYWLSSDGVWKVSVEGYLKWMRNLVDYRDEYYLQPPLDYWKNRLTSGRGSAKGLDLSVERSFGSLSASLGYSLAWADRCFKEKNGGLPFPARFDHRHTIKVSLGWRVNEKVDINAAWIGHSGSRFTLLPQMFQTPGFGGDYLLEDYGVPLRAPINNYQLPFYHRLDISCNVHGRRGFWSFGLYNAYCHMNTVAVTKGYMEKMVQTPYGVSTISVPVFRKFKLLPIIPSVSYTWIF